MRDPIKYSSYMYLNKSGSSLHILSWNKLLLGEFGKLSQVQYEGSQNFLYIFFLLCSFPWTFGTHSICWNHSCCYCFSVTIKLIIAIVYHGNSFCVVCLQLLLPLQTVYILLYWLVKYSTDPISMTGYGDSH